MTICKLIVTVFCAGLLTEPASSSEQDYFRINVVDSKTGRGVPLVELKTVNDIRYYTDSAGTVAFHEPGLMNQTVFFFTGTNIRRMDSAIAARG